MARARVEPTARASAVARFNQLSYETFTLALSNSNMYLLSLPTLRHYLRRSNIKTSPHISEHSLRQLNHHKSLLLRLFES